MLSEDDEYHMGLKSFSNEVLARVITGRKLWREIWSRRRTILGHILRNDSLKELSFKTVSSRKSRDRRTGLVFMMQVTQGVHRRNYKETITWPKAKVNTEPQLTRLRTFDFMIMVCIYHAHILSSYHLLNESHIFKSYFLIKV